MAVYERTYRPYAGELTPEKSRFLVLPRYAYEEVFRSKLFVAFMLLSYVWPLSLALIIYLPHNLSFLEKFGISTDMLLNFFGYGPTFFLARFMIPHAFIAFIVVFVVGPALVSADLKNNGLALYLSRPFTRAEYILGKTSVLIILLSLVTWVPGLLLFFLQAYLGGKSWLADNYSIGIAIFLGSWIWILVLCLLSLAVSAYVKWKPVARAVLLLIWFALAAVGQMLNVILSTSWGDVINIGQMFAVVCGDLFGIENIGDLPVWTAWVALLGTSAFCVMLLSRKVRAYEIVRN